MPAFRFEEVPLRINGCRAGMFDGTAELDEDGHLDAITLDDGMVRLTRSARPLSDERRLFEMLHDEVMANVQARFDEWVRCERAYDRAAAYGDAVYDAWKHEAVA